MLHYVTFATAEGTMHPYYTTALAPGTPALYGGGRVLLLRAFRTDKRWTWALTAGLAVTAVWSITLLRRASGWNTWLWPTVGVVMAAAIAGRFVFRSGKRVRLLAASVAGAVTATPADPAAYAWSVPSGSGGGMGGTNPTAGPSSRSDFGGSAGGRDGFLRREPPCGCGRHPRRARGSRLGEFRLGPTPPGRSSAASRPGPGRRALGPGRTARRRPSGSTGCPWRRTGP